MSTETFLNFSVRLREVIGRHSSLGLAARRNEDAAAEEFNHLALTLFRLQFASNSPYQGYCQSLGITPSAITNWRQIPAIPASAFKELELSSLSASERVTVFCSSGTTDQKPSRHFHSEASLELYRASLLPWFRAHLLAESVHGPGQSNMIFLTPPLSHAPNSSLVYMFDAVAREFGAPDSSFLAQAKDAAWVLNLDAAETVFSDAVTTNRPVILMGPAFSFVHLLDYLVQRGVKLQLPAGSRILETGGYKGRSRSLSKAELHGSITERLGVPSANIISEYGMSELSSQAYDCAFQLSDSNPQNDPRGIFRFPPWARAQIISPETGQQVSDGEPGLIRVFDLANVWSVMSIQTEDLGIRRGPDFELLGRASLAEPRGCSLMLAS